VHLFRNGWDETLTVLNHKDCKKFFCDHGADPARILQTLQSTEYRFLSLPGGSDIGAQTNSPTSVFINIDGPFVTNTDGKIALGGQAYDLHDQDNVQALILLHELGHQLGILERTLGQVLELRMPPIR